MAGLARALEQTSIGLMVRESLWGFPVLVGLHILGLIFSVGFLLWFDLRLVGVGITSERVSSLYRRVMPWAAVGFVSMFTTGGVLFTGFATHAYHNAFFRVKVAMFVLAAVNALYYHGVTERQIAAWEGAARPPAAARVAGVISLALWATVILCGRMMSYTMF